MQPRRFSLLLLLLVLVATGCGKSLDQQLKDSIRTLDSADLKRDDIEILDVQQSGEFAVAEVKVQTAFKLRKQGDQWILEEIRIGDRRWERAEHILAAINSERSEQTRRLLDQVQEAIERYRSERGTLPAVEDFDSLIDLLTPRYLSQVVRRDAWFRSFSFQRLSQQEYDLRSAGVDGELQTADDILAGRVSE